MNLHSTLPKYEDPSFSLFNTLQPCFTQDIDDDWQPCNNGHSISEDVFNKFRLNYLTPPRSPELSNSEAAVEVEVPGVDNFTNSFFNTQSSIAAEEPIGTDCYIPMQFQIMSEFPDLKDACNEFFKPADPSEDPIICQEQTRSKIKADCMWNGNGWSGDKPRATSGNLERASPGAGAGNPAGCVDPRTVFNCRTRGCPNLLRPNCVSRKLINPEDCVESPTESDEEIDVVTVEKKASPQKATRLANKYIGKLVKKNGVHQQLSLVMPSVQQPAKAEETGGRSQVKATRTPQANVALIINETKDKPATKRVSYQLKRVITSSATKRKLNGDNSGTVVQLMRLPAHSVLKVGPKEELSDDQASPPSGKRPFLSLDGVSMVTDTGINRFRNNKTTTTGWIKSEPVEAKSTVFQVQSINVERAKKKPTRRYVKKTASTSSVSYETPTSSPGSSSGDSPSSPTSKKESTSSSEEDCSIRAAHNVLERQRREGLRTLFSTLRLSVPEIMDNERAPKVVILRKAKEHVITLQEESADLQTKKNVCEQQKYKLQKRLQELASEITSLSSQLSQRPTESITLNRYSLYTD